MLGSFYFKHVLSVFGDVNELFEEIQAVFSIGQGYLQENGIITVEDEGWGTEYIQVVHGVKVVFGKPVEDRRIIDIHKEPLHICSGFFSDVFQDFSICHVTAFLVNGIQQQFVENLELIRILLSYCFSSTKGIDPSCPGRVVFPDLLFRFRRMIILFEGEISPYYRKLFAYLSFYILQPDRCVEDERSEIIEIDIEFR